MTNHDFDGNDLEGNRISRFLRELVGWHQGNDICTGTGNNPNYREILREFILRTALSEVLSERHGEPCAF